jgi:hypothetical protein
VVRQGDIISMPPLTHFRLAIGAQKGPSSQPGFFSEHFGGLEDSIVVIFDDKYKVSHYANTPIDTAKKYYLFSSLRNIGNPLSYEFYTTKLKHSKSVENTHVYKFTEQDYLDAK